MFTCSSDDCNGRKDAKTRLSKLAYIFLTLKYSHTGCLIKEKKKKQLVCYRLRSTLKTSGWKEETQIYEQIRLNKIISLLTLSNIFLSIRRNLMTLLFDIFASFMSTSVFYGGLNFLKVAFIKVDCDQNICFIMMKCWWGARGVMVIIVGNGHGDTSSNLGRDWLHFTSH